MDKVRAGLIDTLFATFPREYGASDADITKRKAVYIAMLQDFPVDAIRLACRKAYLECDRLPSIAVLVRSVRSLLGSANEEKRTKGWDEAWKEITRQLYAMPYGRTPEWSTQEIKESVDSYGWARLQLVNAGTDFAVAESQIRRYYESICNRKEEQEINDYILSKLENIKSIPASSVGSLEERKTAGGILVPPKEINGG